MIPLKRNQQNKSEGFYDGPMPMEIDTTRMGNHTNKSLAIVLGQIKDISIPVLCDSCSNVSIMPVEIAKELQENIIEKSNKLSGIATEKNSVGIVKDIAITLAPGCTITEDFVIVEGHEHRELILSRTALKRYNYDLLESREHLVLTVNEKNYFIPIIEKRNLN